MNKKKKRYANKKMDAYREYNQQVEKAGFKTGDRVSCSARNFLGRIGGMTVVTGTVKKRGKYYVALDVMLNGKKKQCT